MFVLVEMGRVNASHPCSVLAVRPGPQLTQYLADGIFYAYVLHTWMLWMTRRGVYTCRSRQQAALKGMACHRLHSCRDVSNNSLSGSVPATAWRELNSLTYL
jgi:hypothetical protein